MRLVEILRRYCSFCKDFDDFKMISQKADNEGRMLRVLMERCMAKIWKNGKEV